jgi:formylglycine-generating enzyme required for sulfatase activity
VALATCLGTALTAQATGRSITTVAPANLGVTAQFAASFPSSAAGNIGWFVMAGHLAGTVPLPIAGFTVNGSCRVHPAVIFQTYLFVIDGSGTSTLSLAVPNSNAFLGFPFDLQTLDANLQSGVLTWGDNDAEVVVGTRGPLPSATMQPIPTGSFAMGSTFGYAFEQPVHQVAITQPFWMGRYEVTQAEYQAVMGNNPSYFRGANRPVEAVTWHQAMAYCAALTASERAAGRVPLGYQYRLPTEAEWEYCCRAGTTTEWNTGTSISTAQANYNNPTSGQTVPVGSYAANAFGLMDVHGNVWEWCLDAWDGSNNYPASAVIDPYVSSGPDRAIRGGSWYIDASDCRSAIRLNVPPTNTNIDVGFRVVLAPVLVP